MTRIEIVRAAHRYDRCHYGGADYPLSWTYMGESYCSFYWSGVREVTFEEWLAARPLLARYKRFCHYVREVRPEWRNDGGPIYYADNSVEQPEVDKDGNRRSRMLVAPHGDLCY